MAACLKRLETARNTTADNLSKTDQSISLNSTLPSRKSDESSVDILKRVDSFWDIFTRRPTPNEMRLSLPANVSSEYVLQINRHSIMDPLKMFIYNIIDEILNCYVMRCHKIVTDESNIEFEDIEEYSKTESRDLEESALIEEAAVSLKEEFEMHQSRSMSGVETDSYLEVSESEIHRMLEDTCKCTEEIVRENYIKEMILKGKLRIRGQNATSVTTVSDVGTFDYSSSLQEEQSMEEREFTEDKQSSDKEFLDYAGESTYDIPDDSELDKNLEDQSEEEQIKPIEVEETIEKEVNDLQPEEFLEEETFLEAEAEEEETLVTETQHQETEAEIVPDNELPEEVLPTNTGEKVLVLDETTKRGTLIDD